MPDALATFTTPDELGGTPIRIRMVDGNPVFITTDVAKALGRTSPTQLGQSLAADEKGAIAVCTPGGEQRLNYVTEAGLYRILLRSNSPNARPFQDWVVTKVLPSLQKHKAYFVGQEKVATGEMSDAEFMATAVLRANQMLESMKADCERLTAENAAMAPKAALVDETFVGRLPTITEVVRKFDGCNLNAIPAALVTIGDWYQTKSGYRVNRGKDRFYRERWERNPFGSRMTAIAVTPEGVVRLSTLYQHGVLPMRKAAINGHSR